MNPYYNQSEQWKNFFLSANNDKHDVFEFNEDGNKIFIYEYPLKVGLKFWYVPRFFLFNAQYSFEDYRNIAKRLVNKIKVEAIEKNISYITFDFDGRFLEKCELSDEGIREYLGLKKSIKKLQYLTTPQLDVTLLEGENGLSVEDFFKVNEKNIFSKVNKTCRNLTRRALEKEWQYEIDYDNQNFEGFWAIWQETAKRHGFSLHPKSYIKQLIDYDWTTFVIIKDREGVVQSGGILVNIEGNMIHLFGANSDKALKEGAQYYFHVLALKLIRERQIKGDKIVTYDMGGSDDDGYGNFKKSYKPDYLYFKGPYDMILKPFEVNIYNVLRVFKSKVKAVIKR
jgi:lipid II:glycine glycyltransferase (peptidoglycan interpeptide bridge formation enzyme)